MTQQSGRLLRVLGLWFGLAAIVGNSIGAGIMRTPSEVARHLPVTEAYLVVWLAGGLYALLGAASLAELGVALPRSGGLYVYAHRAFGPYIGFIAGWSDWVSTCASAAAVSMVVAEYGGWFGGLGPGQIAALATGVVVILAAMLWKGVRSSGTTVELVTLVKVVVLLGVPLIAFATGTREPVAAAPVAAITFAGIVLALQAVIYSYDGWTGVLYFAGEVKDPARDIPRSMFSGVSTVMVIYMLLAGCFVYVLGIGGVAADTFPAGQVAHVIFGDIGSAVIRVVVVLSGLGAALAIIMMGSRIPHAMTGDGLFPRRAGFVNQGGTPVVTLALTALLAMAFIVTGTFNQVIAVAAFFFVLNYVIAFAAVFTLRRKEPDLPRPYRAMGYPVTTAISLLGGAAFLVAAFVQDRRNSLIAIGILLASYPVYRLVRLPREH
jgi:APA family basic amino acid/polyamine antiporter